MPAVPLRDEELSPCSSVALVRAPRAQQVGSLRVPRLAAHPAQPRPLEPIPSSLRVSPARLAILEPVPLATAAGAQRRRSTLGYLAPPPLAQVGPTRRAVRELLTVSSSAARTPLHAADLATWGDRLSSSDIPRRDRQCGRPPERRQHRAVRRDAMLFGSAPRLTVSHRRGSSDRTADRGGRKGTPPTGSPGRRPGRADARLRPSFGVTQPASKVLAGCLPFSCLSGSWIVPS